MTGMQLTNESEATSEIVLGIPLEMRVVRKIYTGTQMQRLDEWKFRLVKRSAP